MKDTHREILLKCGCAGHHYFEMYCDADPEWRGFWVTFIEYPLGFWGKLKAIWKLLVKEDHIYHGELEIAPEDLQRVGEFLVKAGKDFKNADKKNSR